MIRLVLAARYVTFSAVVLLLVFLVLLGKRVTYDQSISSFFAECSHPTSSVTVTL